MKFLFGNGGEGVSPVDLGASETQHLLLWWNNLQIYTNGYRTANQYGGF